MFAAVSSTPVVSPRAARSSRARSSRRARVVASSPRTTRDDDDDAAASSGVARALRRPARFAFAATLAATLAATPPALAATVFAGKYIDPNHPHCPRAIDEAGVITGIDPVPFAEGRGCRGYKKANEASAVAAGKINPWRIEGKIAKDDRSIFIDFDQKDGSGESFTGEWNGAGIVFPDGNQWTKIDDAAAPTSGAQLSSR
jgi:hypothetical protein